MKLLMASGDVMTGFEDTMPTEKMLAHWPSRSEDNFWPPMPLMRTRRTRDNMLGGYWLH